MSIENSTKQKAFIFDIDGTLSNNEHRQNWVRNKPKNWNAYNKEMCLDTPIEAVILTLRAIGLVYPIIISSGRQEDKRHVTEFWFAENDIPFTKMYMRKTGDYRDDVVVKLEMLEEIKKKYEVVAVFDDRVKVVNGWRSAGLYVFDCNQTREEF